MGPFRVYPRGEFDGTASYRFLDLVTYYGSSYICINYDTIDGTACIGVSPVGQAQSPLYWQLVASKGDTGSPPDAYQNFITVTNGVWDYSRSDKIIIPPTGNSEIGILNVYNGCCGIILTEIDLSLPYNSDFSVDFNYIPLSTNQYYMYSFVYGNPYGSGDRFIWNRCIYNKA